MVVFSVVTFACLLVAWSNATSVVFWFRKVQSSVILNSHHEFIRTVDFDTGNCSIQLSYLFFPPFSAGISCVRSHTTTTTVSVLCFMLFDVCPLPHTGTGRCLLHYSSKAWKKQEKRYNFTKNASYWFLNVSKLNSTEWAKNHSPYYAIHIIAQQFIVQCNWNDRRSRRVFLCFYSAIF